MTENQDTSHPAPVAHSREEALMTGQTFYLHSPNHIIHLLLTVFTGGLWLPVWIVIALMGKKVKAVE